ncbi:MAG: hypothetical protein ACRD18_01180, partial [Terriglobia bacterium]
ARRRSGRQQEWGSRYGTAVFLGNAGRALPSSLTGIFRVVASGEWRERRSGGSPSFRATW